MSNTNRQSAPLLLCVFFFSISIIIFCFPLHAVAQVIPRITTVSPGTHRPGSLVTIAGSGFTTTGSEPIVLFGASRGIVAESKSDMLRVISPTGSTLGPVTVTNLSSQRSAVSRSFQVPKFPALVAPGFAAAVHLPTGNEPIGLALSDLDGDGKNDLIVTNSMGQSVYIYRNVSTHGVISTGSFAAPVQLSTGPLPEQIAIGDLDGDGRPDIGIANAGANSVSIFRNLSVAGILSSASFGPRIDLPLGAKASCITFGDLDADGRPEIIAGQQEADSAIHIFRNTLTPAQFSEAGFSSKIYLDPGMGSGPRQLRVADMDGDGMPDILFNRLSSSRVFVLRNGSAGGSLSASSFSMRGSYETGVGLRDIALADLDVDGKLDMAISWMGMSMIKLVQNRSVEGRIDQESFQGGMEINSRVWQSTGCAVADLNGDGKPELIATAVDQKRVSIFPNISTPGTLDRNSFDVQIDLPTGEAPGPVAAGDLDGDGKPELVILNTLSNTLSILHNQTGPEIPYVGYFTPSTASMGTTLTLFGAGFSPAVAGNIVTFGAVRAQVLSAAAQQLTVRVPAGATYGPITVTRTDNGLSASSSSFFLPRFYGQSGSARFAPRVDLPAGEMPAYLTLADLDLDGKPDILATDYGRTSLNVIQNTAEPGSILTGSFKPKFDLGTGNNTYGLAVGDLDGDGKQDVVVTNRGSTSIAIFRNISTTGTLSIGSFAPAVNISVQATPVSVHIGDIDGDGKPELLVANNEGDRISILKNLSSVGSLTSASFAAPVLFTTGSVARYLAIGDLDSDGKADVVVVNQATGELQLFRNTSTPGRIDAGSLTAVAVFAAGGMIRTVNIGDLDGDGRPDLMATNYRDTDQMYVLQNTTSPGVLNAASFATPFTLKVGRYAKNLSVGDLNGDGKPDLAVISDEGATNNVSLHFNTHTTGSLTPASFSSPQILSAGFAPFGIAIGDLDSDGRPELVISAEASEKINIFRNETPLAEAPVITTISPVRAAPGGTVTISGRGFDPTGTRNIVHFGATRATVTAGDTGSLSVVVPKGATFGSVTVTHPGIHLTAFSQRFFEPTFAGKPSPLNLSSRTNLALPDQPAAIASGDLDGDGRADLVSLSSSGQLSIHRNISTAGTLAAASFATRIDLATGVDPRALVIADVDGDGWKDIALADQGGSRLSIFRNRGLAGALAAGTFDDRFDIPVTGKVRSLVAGDLDRDGRPDLIITRLDQDSVSVIRNLSRMPGSFSSSSFSSPVNCYVGPNPHALALGDLDGDGRPDLAVALESASWVAVLRNVMPTGTIDRSGFPAPVMLRTAAIGVSGGAPTHVAIGDLDGDGKPDIIAPNHVEGRIAVFRNLASAGSLTDASFSARITLPAATGFEPFQVALSDMDGDGKPDLTILGPAAGKLRILKNQASPGSLSEGSFKENGVFDVGLDPRGLMVGDLDNDGQPDMAVVNRGSHTLTIVRLDQQQLPACLPAFDPFPAAIYSKADSLRLDAGSGYTTYAWNTGSTGSSIHVKYSGNYRVTVTLAGICSSSDSVIVQFPDTVGLRLPGLQAACGDSLDLPLRATAFRHLMSMQGSLRWDVNDLEFVRIADLGPARLQLTAANFGTAQTASGKFSFSWVDPQDAGASLPDTAILFTLRFRVTGKTLRNSVISFSNDPTPIEFIDGNTKPRNVATSNGSLDIRCTIRISGQIRTPNDQPVRNVQVSLGSSGTPLTATTDSSGRYQFDVPAGTYTLTPAKSTETYKTNGISTIDLVYIQAHILQRTPFTSAYKMIASDANRSESITAGDILLIRRLILGADTTIPGGMWAFVDGDQTFASPQAAFPFRQTKTFTNLSSDVTHLFRAIRIGDVNEDRNPMLDQAPSGDTLRLMGEWTDTDDGFFDLRIRSRAVSALMGWQTTIQWDPRQLHLQEASSLMKDLGMGARWKAEGMLTISWHDPQATGLNVTEGVDWISLRFRKLGAFQQAHVNISGEKLATEVFNGRFQSMALRMDQTMDRSPDHPFRAYPNPIREDLQLAWTMNAPGGVRIRLVDPMGRIVFEERRWAKAGPQHYSRRLTGIRTSGTYVLMLEADGRVRSKRVFVSGY